MSCLLPLICRARALSQGYAKLMSDFDDFWQRRLYSQISDCWNRPINSVWHDTATYLSLSLSLSLSCRPRLLKNEA